MDSVSKLAERMGGIREYIVYALGSRGTISRCGWLVAMVACMFVAVGCATDKRSAEHQPTEPLRTRYTKLLDRARLSATINRE